jgi:hypothetical protein
MKILPIISTFFPFICHSGLSGIFPMASGKDSRLPKAFGIAGMTVFRDRRKSSLLKNFRIVRSSRGMTDSVSVNKWSHWRINDKA